MEEPNWRAERYKRLDDALRRHLSELYRREECPVDVRLADSYKHKFCQERIAIDGNIVSYIPDEEDQVGVYMMGEPLNIANNYFEIELLNSGVSCSIAIGLVSGKHPLNQHPGWVPKSIGFHIGQGRLHKGTSKGLVFGPKCEVGDRIGCGIEFDKPLQDNQRPYVNVFFTKNRKEFGITVCSYPLGGFYPAISLQSPGEEVHLCEDVRWIPEEDMFMCIDSNEDDWSRLHDIKLNGSFLEYTGRGKSIIDVGLAQARFPLTTTCHYFEIEIMNPGENCYISIGLARRDYPKYRHPGWNKGSIAYHADDGKIFVGSGVGEPFGPRCHKGDVMGCGIIFPRDYVCRYESTELYDLTPSPSADQEEDFPGSLSDSEDEEWWKENENIEVGATIQVFFTRNGKTIGQKEVCIPKGGFYPTVGMLSLEEKVKVDLHPLSG